MRLSRALAIPLFAMIGGAWGVVALLLGGRAFGPPVWAGVVASPFIGVIVSFTTQARFQAGGRVIRKALALASLYLGATLFGLVLGVYDWWPGGVGQSFVGALGEGVGTVLYGLTMGFVIGLWPLAYLTHVLLEAIDRRVAGG